MKNVYVKLSLTLGLIFIISAVFGQKADRPEEKAVLVEKLFIEANKEKVLGNSEEAVYLFNEVLRRDKDNSAAFYELSRLYQKIDQGKKAVEKASKAYKLDDKNLFYGVNYAKLLESQGEYKAAADIYGKMTTVHPDNHDLFFEWAYFLMKSGKAEQAVKAYNALEAKIGVNEETSIRKHKVYSSIGKSSKAINELEKLIDSFPKEVRFYNLLAQYFESLGKSGKAGELYKELLKVDPNNPKANVELAKYYKTQGDETQYLKSLGNLFENPQLSLDDKIKTLLPYLTTMNRSNDVEMINSLTSLTEKIANNHSDEARAHAIYADVLFQQGKLNLAAGAYKKTLDIDVNKLDVWQNYLYCLAELGRNEELIKGSNELMDLFPVQPSGYYFNGVANNNIRNFKDAIKPLEQALMMTENKSLKADIYSMLGKSYYYTNQIDKSDKTFEKALRINPDHFIALNEYSYLLSVRSENLDKAEDMAKKANFLVPDNFAFQDTYAWVLYKKKDYRNAKKWAEKALVNGGDRFSEILEHYGDILYRLNENSKAVEYWQKALDMGSTSELLDKKVATGKLYE